MSAILRIVPWASMNAIDKATYVLRIQKERGRGASNTNSIPASGGRLKRYISPVERCSFVAATSATSVVLPIVSLVVGRPVFGLPICASAGAMARKRVRAVKESVDRIILNG